MAERRLTKGQCRTCGEVNDAERLYCNGCGAKLFEPCLACEVEIGVWERFCGKCGANVAEADRASPPKLLTKEIAERLWTGPGHVDLGEFTELDDDAAESLSKYKGYLSLDGLMSLSDAAAESLCRLELGCLSLELDHFMTSSGNILQSHLTWGINRDD